MDEEQITPECVKNTKGNYYRRFIRGPIGLEWMKRAANLPGKAGIVGLMLWWQSGLKKRKDELKLTNHVCEQFGVGSDAKGNAFELLQSAGLIECNFRVGRPTLVTIRELDVCQR